LAEDLASCYAKPAKKSTEKTPGLDERSVIPLFSVQPLYVVELKLSLRMRLTRQTHARHAQPVEKSITSLALRLR
jgi:hypothetical protein